MPNFKILFSKAQPFNLFPQASLCGFFPQASLCGFSKPHRCEHKEKPSSPGRENQRVGQILAPGAQARA